MTEWTKASTDLIAIAEGIIKAHHPNLLEARIGFVFRDKAQKSKGRKVLGKASTIPERMKPYLNLDFMIWISEEDWHDMLRAKKEALIDHELCHCYLDGDGNPKTRHHDVEEFIDVIRRHGIWSLNLARFQEAIQERLPGMKLEGAVVAIDPEELPVEG